MNRIMPRFYPVFILFIGILLNSCKATYEPINFEKSIRVKAEIEDRILGRKITPLFLDDSTIVLGNNVPKAFNIYTGEKINTFDFDDLNYDSLVALL